MPRNGTGDDEGYSNRRYKRNSYAAIGESANWKTLFYFLFLFLFHFFPCLVLLLVRSRFPRFSLFFLFGLFVWFSSHTWSSRSTFLRNYVKFLFFLFLFPFFFYLSLWALSLPSFTARGASSDRIVRIFYWISINSLIALYQLLSFDWRY